MAGIIEEAPGGFPPVPTERCPAANTEECIGEHLWQPATYRVKGWVAYHSPVRRADHPNLRYCDQYGRFDPRRPRNQGGWTASEH